MYTKAQEQVVIALNSKECKDADVARIVEISSIDRRRTEAMDIWNKVLTEFNHPFHHQEANGHLDAVRSMSAIGLLAYDEGE